MRLVIFYLKVKKIMIKACMFWLIKYDLWLNACYVVNMPWNMKSNYFTKVCFRQHMVRTVPQPLREKNIARGDEIRVRL